MDYKSYVESKFVDILIKDVERLIGIIEVNAPRDFQINAMDTKESVKNLKEFRESLKKKAQETNPELKVEKPGWSDDIPF